MTIRKYNLSMDVKDQSYAPQIITRQGDSTGTTQLNVSITDNGAPVSFTGTPQFRALTSISKMVVVDSSNFSNVNADQGTFTYKIPSQVLSEPGRIYVAYFAIADSSGIESTVGLTIYVQQAADLNPEKYGDYVSAVDGVIESTQESITDLKQKIADTQSEWAAGDFYNKAETDSKDTATLSSAKSYADTQDAATLASAKSYADKDNYYTKSEVNTKINTLITDTGWVKVTLINGWNGDISVRLRDGVIYHKGWLSLDRPGVDAQSTVFKYPDSFGDMSDFDDSNSGWVALTYDGYGYYGYIKGATKEFWCFKRMDKGKASVSSITFKL